MPTDVARDIVNALFAGQKDLSDYVVQGMNAKAVDAIDARKQEVGKVLFKPVSYTHLTLPTIYSV